MKLEVTYFKRNSKYYSTEDIEVPDDVTDSIKLHQHLKDHRDDYGHDGMFMVVFPPDPITVPVLVQPDLDEVSFADIPDEEIDKMYELYQSIDDSREYETYSYEMF